MPLDPDLIDWFARNGEAGEDLRARVNRALREHVAREQRAVGQRDEVVATITEL